MTRTRRDGLITFAVALAARLAVVVWAFRRIPATADGTYYQIIAERISKGLGYTWQWPDGAVTFASHYPVGYPAMAGAAYAIFGPSPGVAMALNALLGAAGALAVHLLASRAFHDSRPRLALVAGLLVALHPGLVAYTPALMTEGVTASLLAVAAAVAASCRDRRLPSFLALGLVVGVATLVRPQSLLVAPAFALLAAFPSASDKPRLARLLGAAALATVAALAVCAPWTARNCVRMKSCALVSVNGGWNLLIGADQESTGAWSPIKVPEACREVFDEAGKDACFGREARSYIEAHPATWLSLVPKKLFATFDYAGAAPWYLHQANPEAFPWRAKEALGAVETLYERALVLLALAWAARPGPREPRLGAYARVAAALFAVVSLFTLHATIAYVALPLLALSKPRALVRGPLLASASVVVLLSTIVVHAVFFGAGRYSLVVFPFVAGLSALGLEAFDRRSLPRAS